MRSCRRRFCTHVASGLISAVLADAAAQSAPAQSVAPAVDAVRDPRLIRMVRLRSEGMPISKVLRGLSAATGVRLDAPGRTGDERLVAFVPGGTLAEVMSAISELFRLEWLRAGSDQPSYRLFKSLTAHREESLLRERSLQGMLSRLQRVMQGGPVVQLERTQLGQEELVPHYRTCSR